MCHLGTLRLHFYLCHSGPWSSASFAILCYVRQAKHFSCCDTSHMLESSLVPKTNQALQSATILSSLIHSKCMKRRQWSLPWLLCRLQPNIMDVCFSSLQVNWKVAAAGGRRAGAGPLSAVRLRVPALVCKYWLYAVLQPSIVHTATNMMIGVILQIQCVH